jgi:hypothetical protein
MKQHIRWVKRWNKLYKVPTKFKFGVKKPISRKLQKNKKTPIGGNQEMVVVVIDEVSDYDEEWCDECLEKIESHIRDMRIYPL